MNRKIIMIICVGFVLGLFIGLVCFRIDFSPKKVYPVDATVVQAYFKLYNTSEASGVAFRTILSYVFIVNITNPSDTTLHLDHIQIYQTDHVFSYDRTFSESNAYWFYPHTSTLVAFTENKGLYESGLRAFNPHNLGYLLGTSFSPIEGKGHGESSKLNEWMQLKSIGSDEYIYGSAFDNESRFLFLNGDGMIGVGTSSKQLG